MDWKKQSEMFDQTAEYYDAYRPSYPAQIIEALISHTKISPQSKLLEIGSGSGKATELLAPYGYDIYCVDPGESLINKGREKFAAYHNIRFVAARFEELHLAPKSYDLIFSAQAFHWVPQPIGYEKCSYALKDQGHLALFWNMYLLDDHKADRELLALSQKYGGFADFVTAEGCEKRINTIAAGIENSGYFHAPVIHRCLWYQHYSADEYFGFVLTGNSFVQKSAEEKLRAYDDIKALAEKNGGLIKRPYLCVLYLASKK